MIFRAPSPRTFCTGTGTICSANAPDASALHRSRGLHRSWGWTRRRPHRFACGFSRVINSQRAHARAHTRHAPEIVVQHLSRSRIVPPLVGVLLALACGDGSGPDQAGPPAEVEVLSGDHQQGTVGRELPQSLVLRVTDADGDPVPNQTARFVVTAGGGSASPATATSDARGEVRVRWTLGTVAGAAQMLEVRPANPAAGVPAVVAVLEATAVHDVPATVTVHSGSGQTGPLDFPLSQSIFAKVADRFGNGVPNVAVTFAAAAGGQVTPGSTTTDLAGLAIGSWRLGDRADVPQTVAASVPGVGEAIFSATGTLDGATVTAIGGLEQTGATGAALPESLCVRVLLTGGRPAHGATVRFTPAAGSGSASPAQATADAQGRAAARWTLGAQQGTQRLVASAHTSTGASGPSAEFTAAAQTAGVAAAVAVVSGEGQRQLLSQVLPEPLVYRVTDAFGGPVAGVPVRFQPDPQHYEQYASRGLGPTAAQSDAQGLVRFTWLLGETFGLQTARVTAFADAGATTPLAALTATAGAETAFGYLFEKVGGEGQSAPTGATLAEPLVVRLRQTDGTPVRGAAVQFDRVTAAGGVEPLGAVLTDADGRAVLSYVVGDAAQQTVRAYVRRWDGTAVAAHLYAEFAITRQ
jgi:5-hydroxyisourate hydrolase-like protein (transthyretin family)